MQFDSLDALKAAAPAAVKGRIVYIGYRMQRAKDGHDYDMGSAVRMAGPVIAAGKGAAGYLLRSAGTDAHQRIAHTGVTGFEDQARAIPAAALSNPDADQLERILAMGKPVTVKLDLDCGVVGEYTGANVIWRMSASVKPGARDAIGQIAGVLAPLGVAYDAAQPGGGGSDLSQMHGKGMAALSLTQDGTHYFDWHHASNDTLDKIDPQELTQNVAVYAVFSYMAAQADADFGSTAGAFADDGADE